MCFMLTILFYFWEQLFCLGNVDKIKNIYPTIILLMNNNVSVPTMIKIIILKYLCVITSLCQT